MIQYEAFPLFEILILEVKATVRGENVMMSCGPPQDLVRILTLVSPVGGERATMGYQNPATTLYRGHDVYISFNCSSYSLLKEIIFVAFVIV